MKVVKYKDSLLRRGIDVYGILQLPNPEKGRRSLFVVGLEFWKEDVFGIDMIYYTRLNNDGTGTIYADSFDPHWTYIILPDYQYDIFNDLKLVGECERDLFLKWVNSSRIDIDWEVWHYIENTIKSYESRTVQTEPNQKGSRYQGNLLEHNG